MQNGKKRHSPFVNDFITNVLRGEDINDYNKIEKLYKDLLNDYKKLNRWDLGAGSVSGSEQFLTVRQIVKHSSISFKYGRLLSRLVCWIVPSTIIELGTGAGFSTMYMASASENCKVFSIEGCPDIAKLAERNMKKLNPANTEIITGPFNKTLLTVLPKIQNNLLVFIDGDHRGDHLISYYESILPFTNENSVFVLDDIRWSASMEKAWKYLINRKEITVSIDLFRMGILFMKKNLPKGNYCVRF